MQPVQSEKTVLVLPPVSASGGAHSGNTYVDTQGWGHVRFKIIAGSLGANVGSTNSTTPLYVEECDTAGGGYSAVTGAAMAAVLTGTTHNNTVHGIDIALTKSHSRYMRMNAPTAGAGACVLAIEAILSRKESGFKSGSAADSGLTTLVSA